MISTPAGESAMPVWPWGHVRRAAGQLDPPSSAQLVRLDQRQLRRLHRFAGYQNSLPSMISAARRPIVARRCRPWCDERSGSCAVAEVLSQRLRGAAASAMPIDVHAHYVPPSMLEALQSRAKDFSLSLVEMPSCPASSSHSINGLKVRPFSAPGRAAAAARLLRQRTGRGSTVRSYPYGRTSLDTACRPSSLRAGIVSRAKSTARLLGCRSMMYSAFSRFPVPLFACHWTRRSTKLVEGGGTQVGCR